jgi:penicillin-binding protein 1A
MMGDSNKLWSNQDVRGEGDLPAASADREWPPYFLRRRAFRHRVFRRAIGSVAVAICIVPLVLLIWALYGIPFPSPLPSPKAVAAQPAIVVNAADGQPIFGQSAFRLAPIDAKNMPPVLLNAVLSTEDRGFYQHGAISPSSVVRAFIDNLRAGKIVAGGSTITQQLVKMRFLGPERTYRRKLEEAAIATWLQYHLTKDQILTSYLNNVYLGSGATGFPAAAKLYFNKNLDDLTLPEAAMLAGMINAPTQDDPLLNLQAARNRAATVLDAMVANGKLSQEDALAAKLHPATPARVAVSPPLTGWFADWIYDQAAKVAPKVDGATEVHTTLDSRLQNLAATIVQSTLATYGPQKGATQAALVVMRPDGAVLAMVGGRNYSESKFNRAVNAKRQPGSAFKLFDYYAALRAGFSPEDQILDEPVDIKGWEPENYGRRYHGRVTLADAFAHSLNDAAVRLSQQVGINQVIAAARDLGLHAPLHNEPSLALGTSEVSLLDLTSAYAAVRAGVAPVEPWGITSVHLPNATHLVSVGRPDEPQHSLGQYQQALISLLQGVVQHGTGRAAALPGFAAGKTGTSQDYRDAWFIGFDDSLVVGVWVGNDDHSPMRGVVGGSLPAMIWKAFMEQVPPSPAPVTAQQAPAAAQQASGNAQQQINPPAPPRVIPKTQTVSPQTAAGAQPQASAAAQPPKRLFDQHNFSTSQNNASAPAGTAGAKCDISMCQQHYHSFRASDCTYQPYDGGPRRSCARPAETLDGTSSHQTEGRSAPPPPHYGPHDPHDNDDASGHYGTSSRNAEGHSAEPPSNYDPPDEDDAPGPLFGLRGDGW